MCTVIKIILCIFISCSIASCLQLGSNCKTKTGEDGTCKEYKNCPSIKLKLRNKEMTVGDLVKCTSYGVICCPDENSEKLNRRIGNYGEISKRSKNTF
jgi:hypothetical protein